MKNCTSGWSLYNVFDKVKKIDGNIEAEFYYVETDNYFPFKGGYDADLVFYACNVKF